MSPERFHDALNYLDDDLIQQTDDLRQGRRVLQTRPTARQVIRWAVPAACLVLLISQAPRMIPMMESADSSVMEQDVEYGNQTPEKPLQDFMEADNSGSTRYESVTGIWETYTCGDFSLTVPENWTTELESREDGSLFVVLRPPQEDGAIRVGHTPSFGVCGTGLETTEQIIAGMNASVGTYDGNHVWSFITFPGDYVAINDGADTWWGVYGDTVMEILDTLVIAEKE